MGTFRHLFEARPLSSFPSESFRGDLVGGVVSSAVAIPLAIGFGMFAFVPLGDQYFAWGAVSGLISALVVGMVNVVLGERSTMVYAPRVTTTFFLGLLLNSLLHSDAIRTPSASAALAVFFAIVLVGGVFQALFGLMRLGTLIKFTPHPVMAGFQNMAAALLFLVQIGNVLGFDKSVGFTRAFGYLGSARPLSVLVAALTFAAMWHARKLTTIVPPLLVGLGCGIAAYYFLLLAGFGTALGPVIGLPTASATMNNVLADFSSRSIAELLAHSAPVILTSALALAFIASMDALLCLKLASPPAFSILLATACSCVSASPTRPPRASAASPAASISAQASPIARLGEIAGFPWSSTRLCCWRSSRCCFRLSPISLASRCRASSWWSLSSTSTRGPSRP